MAVVLITADLLDRMQPGDLLWDTEVRGFGARRQKNDVVFVFKANLPGTKRQIFVTIGKRRRGEWNLREARTKATELRYKVIRGEDPTAVKREARGVMTVAELCDAYLLDALETPVGRAGRPKKASTLASDVSRIEAHIKPLLGKLRVPDVTAADISTFQQRTASGATAKPRKEGRGGMVTGGRGVAARSMGLLGAIFSYAVRTSLRSDNPVRGVKRFGDQRRERRLTDDEYRRLGEALDKVKVDFPVACGVVQFLLLTGWRRGEALALRWSEIDRERRTVILGDTKTGRSMRPLARAAQRVIDAMPVISGNPYVFAAPSGGGAIPSVRPAMWRVAALAKLPADITLHTFRHSLASVAADLGLSEPTIAALLGHKGQSVTARYVHSADAVVLAAADRVADAVLDRMGEAKPDSEVVQLRR
jgi:integrase